MSKPPELPPDTDILAWLLSLPPEGRAEALGLLGRDDAEALDAAWREWAHEGQRPPDRAPDGSDWRTWVIMAGRGFGKTLAGAQWVLDAVKRTVSRGVGRSLVPSADHARSPLRIALVAATLDEARRVMVEGESGLLAVADSWIARWEPTKRVLRFAGGAEAHLFSGASPEQLRGPQHHLAWCDELAKWEKAGETWDMLQLGLRLGGWPRALVTTTPRPGPVLRRIMARPDCVVTGGPTRANPHLPPAYVDNVHSLFAGTRLERQELNGELLTDNPGALWTVELLDNCRLPLSPAPSTTWRRTVIAVDPPSGDGTCGIIACAKDSEGRAHVLADHSVTARTPEGWARAVADAARIHSIAPPPLRGRGWGEGSAGAAGGGEAPTPTPTPPQNRIWVMCPRRGEYVLQPGDPPRDGECSGRPSPGRAADCRGQSAPEHDHSPPANGGGGPGRNPVLIVAEQNQGGQMIAAVLRIADPNLKVKLVTATQGKTDRAAPVAMLFEAGRVVLHGRFPELEAELCGMIAGGGYDATVSGGQGAPGKSPDRADAMVWGLTELMLQKERAMPRVTGL